MGKKRTKRPVLITDTHRGVYFGYLTETRNDDKTVCLEGMRHAFYYTCEGERGVYALAVVGPSPKSKIGPRVTATINDVNKIVECTEVATKAWESAAWR